MAHAFTDATFEEEVLKSDVPVLVDFWAPWCGPCKVLGPIIDELAEEVDASKVKIGKMNIDENPATPGQYGVMSIPTLIVFKGGEPVEQMVGLQRKDALLKKLNSHV